MNNNAKKRHRESSTAFVDRLLERYATGKDTETGFILDFLTITDEQAIKHGLAAMHPALCDRLITFVRDVTAETQVFSGPQPNLQTVRMVRRLLGQRAPQSSGQSPRQAMTARRKTGST